MKKIIIAVAIVVGALLVLAGTKAMQIRKMMATPWVPPPETISSAEAHTEQWQDSISAVGSINAVQGVIIAPEVAGKVSEIAFESGAVVAKGDLLVRFDTSTEEAQLKASEAQLEWARVSVERSRKLRTDSTVSQSELDQAEAGWKQADANVDAIRTAISKKTIRAPFAGRTGIRQINIGEYVETGKPIVSLESLSPVYADFSLPQQDLAQLKTGMVVRVTTDTYTNRVFEGTLTAINPDLDAATRNVRVQATLENTNQMLSPGMFARMEVLLPVQQDVIVIPATAVLSAPYGDSVYIIDHSTNGLVARQQFVRTGRSRGDFISVESGLKPGDHVVRSGVFKLRNQMPVVENNDLVPPATEKPKPSNS